MNWLIFSILCTLNECYHQFQYNKIDFWELKNGWATTKWTVCVELVFKVILIFFINNMSIFQDTSSYFKVICKVSVFLFSSMYFVNLASFVFCLDVGIIPKKLVLEKFTFVERTILFYLRCQFGFNSESPVVIKDMTHISVYRSWPILETFFEDHSLYVKVTLVLAT